VIPELIGLFAALIGLGGLLVVLRSKKKRDKTPAVIAYLVLMALGLWFASPFYGVLLNALHLSPASEVGFSQVLIENQTQVFTQRVAPIECDKGTLVFWREFKTFSVTKGNETKKYTTVTLYIENKGNASISNFLLKEHLPEAVASSPSELFNFTAQPYRFEKGSVVVTWLFDNIGPGEKKSVSYTVEKEIDEKTMGEYQAPQVLAQQIGGQENATQKQPTESKTAGFDFTLVGIIAVMIVLAGVILYLMRQAQA